MVRGINHRARQSVRQPMATNACVKLPQQKHKCGKKKEKSLDGTKKSGPRPKEYVKGKINDIYIYIYTQGKTLNRTDETHTEKRKGRRSKKKKNEQKRKKNSIEKRKRNRLLSSAIRTENVYGKKYDQKKINK